MIKHVSDLLTKTAAKFPDKVAIVSNGSRITYTELDRLCKKVASEILRKNIKKEPIFILLKKSIECIVAFLGVLRSGNFYATIAEDSPKDRILSVVKKIEPKLLITSSEFDFSYLNLPTILTNDFENFNIDKSLLEDASIEFVDADLAYILFTSGSTGEPKGFAVNHLNLIDYITWAVEKWGINESDIVANQAYFHFDKSVLDIYPCIFTGATLHILQNSDYAFPSKIIDYFEANNITQTGITPQIITYFANTNALKPLPCLRRVFISGEITPIKQLKEWMRIYPHAKFINLYGPSEVTGICSYYVCHEDLKDDEILPAGRACENIEIFLLDENLNIINKNDVGKRGIVYVRGRCVSQGYYNDVELSKSVFMQNPINNKFRDYVYKTGDVAYYNDRGELVCVGRADNQIKLAGHRIELGEIESIIGAIEGVKRTACVFWDNKIFAFYESDSEIDIASILKQKLPRYMIPKYFVKIDKFKLNVNTKIDRNALKDLAKEMR
ncbi:amino acid adenylation domain-containing protein [Campylobacter concisus]|jgi:amino acid adenylation domain